MGGLSKMTFDEVSAMIERLDWKGATETGAKLIRHDDEVTERVAACIRNGGEVNGCHRTIFSYRLGRRRWEGGRWMNDQPPQYFGPKHWGCNDEAALTVRKLPWDANVLDERCPCSQIAECLVKDTHLALFCPEKMLLDERREVPVTIHALHTNEYFQRHFGTTPLVLPDGGDHCFTTQIVARGCWNLCPMPSVGPSGRSGDISWLLSHVPSGYRILTAVEAVMLLLALCKLGNTEAATHTLLLTDSTDRDGYSVILALAPEGLRFGRARDGLVYDRRTERPIEEPTNLYLALGRLPQFHD